MSSASIVPPSPRIRGWRSGRDRGITPEMPGVATYHLALPRRGTAASAIDFSPASSTCSTCRASAKSPSASAATPTAAARCDHTIRVAGNVTRDAGRLASATRWAARAVRSSWPLDECAAPM